MFQRSKATIVRLRVACGGKLQCGVSQRLLLEADYAAGQQRKGGETIRILLHRGAAFSFL